ncbi:DUF4097 family beta strand repeat-containing protein [Kitasatospora sp. HPMI-4]|uniref:DUF4097 family beta strand repeat-containing protein n=1 Tax=Kitasatospora sp. HPMI-4 TaxID=3448443 RepID=UPI003F1A75DB
MNSQREIQSPATAPIRTRRSSTRARQALAWCTVTVAAGALLTGCGSDKVSTETQTYQVSEHITTLNVQSPGGTIEVVAGTQNTVQVTETLRYNGDKPKSTHTTSGAQLSLQASECGSGLFGDKVCEVGYRVEVPKDVAAHLHSSGGTIKVTGLAGATELSSDGGAIHADGLTAKQVTAKADGGSISVGFAAVPDQVTLTTSGGNVSTQLPDGVYAVDAGTTGGSQQVQVKTDPSAPHRIKVHTDGGNISVTSAG